MHPNRCVVSEFHPNWDGKGFVRPVSWEDGQKYGVLRQDKDDHWEVYWFSPEDVNLRGRYWVLGGGQASIELSSQGGQAASEEFLDEVGFNPQQRELWRRAVE